MIGAEMLEIFQMPPSPYERDTGTVEAFTPAELDAIHRYNEALNGLWDCLHDSALWEDRDVGANIAEIGMQVGWLDDWFTTLDSLDADLRDGSGRLSNAADRAMAYETSDYLRCRDRIRENALRYLVGGAGQGGITIGGHVTFSNGIVHLD
jgi:hypothetical protein